MLSHRSEVLLLSHRSHRQGAGTGVSLTFVDAETLFEPEKVYGHADRRKGNLKDSRLVW